MPKILVVEDEVIIRWDTCDHLREAKFEVLEASSVTEATLIIDGHPDIDVLFTDVQLAGSQTGLDLARQMRKRFPKLLILITSGHLYAGQIPKQLGELIEKPYSAAAVAAKIGGILADKSRAKKNREFGFAKLAFQT